MRLIAAVQSNDENDYVYVLGSTDVADSMETWFIDLREEDLAHWAMFAVRVSSDGAGLEVVSGPISEPAHVPLSHRIYDPFSDLVFEVSNGDVWARDTALGGDFESKYGGGMSCACALGE